MAGFEIVVRPVVFPDIRPAPSRSLPPENDPTKGFCVIKGASGKVIDLPMSWNVSTSKSRPVETERRVDEVTIYQQNDDGSVNRKNFVKMKVANQIKMREEGDPIPRADPVLGLLPGTPTQKPMIRKDTYSRPQAAPNIEIGATNIIEKNPDAPP